MGCLIEALLEILLEGWLELMQWIVPNKILPKWVRYVLRFVVALFSIGVFIMFFWGVIGWIAGEQLGKTLVFIAVAISVVQIGLGIVLRCTFAKLRGPYDPHFKASIYSIDKMKQAPLTMVSCEVQDGELNSGDVVLFMNEEGFSLGMGTVCSIKYGRKDVNHIEKSLLAFSVKLLVQDVQDKPIDKAVNIIKQ